MVKQPKGRGAPPPHLVPAPPPRASAPSHASSPPPAPPSPSKEKKEAPYVARAGFDARHPTALTVYCSDGRFTDAVEELLDELPRAGRISFHRLTAGLVERLEVIVRFLALLEMYKQGIVDLEQAERFGDIEIVWTPEHAVAGVGEGRVDGFAIDDYEG